MSHLATRYRPPRPPSVLAEEDHHLLLSLGKSVTSVTSLPINNLIRNTIRYNVDDQQLMRCRRPLFQFKTRNANGVSSFSPAVATKELPRVKVFEFLYPEGVLSFPIPYRNYPTKRDKFRRSSPFGISLALGGWSMVLFCPSPQYTSRISHSLAFPTPRMSKNVHQTTGVPSPSFPARQGFGGCLCPSAPATNSHDHSPPLRPAQIFFFISNPLSISSTWERHVLWGKPINPPSQAPFGAAWGPPLNSKLYKPSHK